MWSPGRMVSVEWDGGTSVNIRNEENVTFVVGGASFRSQQVQQQLSTPSIILQHQHPQQQLHQKRNLCKCGGQCCTYAAGPAAAAAAARVVAGAAV